MAKSSQSPRSRARHSIPEAYRARGRGVNNLWLVYSVKTDRDWILPSDRQLVHWLYFLESDPQVVSFDLAPEPILSNDDKEQRATELDAIVVFRDRHVEWHEVKEGLKLKAGDRSQFLAQETAAQKAGAKYRIINDTELRPNSRVAMRWMKALGFAAAIRGQEQNSCRIALTSCLHSLKSGYIQTIISELEGFDQAVVLGMCVRLAISGAIHLDLAERTFGLATRWRLDEH
jgi:hypothetical protein